MSRFELPADYDAWKTRSDRDDDWWNEPEPEEEETDMINENEIAKELNTALGQDFPGAKLKHRPEKNGGAMAGAAEVVAQEDALSSGVKLSAEIDQAIAGLEARIRVLAWLKATL